MVNSSARNDIFSGITRINDLLERRTQLTPENNALAVRSNTGIWEWISWREFTEQVESAGRMLKQQDLHPGDAIAIIGATSIAWDIFQYAILKCGGIVVGVDSHDTDDNIQNILESASVKGIICDNPQFQKRLPEQTIKNLSFILSIDSTQKFARPFFSKSDITSEPSELNESKAEISSEQVATIIFTSGTTGKPKGIPYSHKQVIEACRAITTAYYDVNDNANLACWLPLSNLFQRMMNYCAIAVGAKTFYVSNPKEIATYLPEINPTVFIAVPRFYEKIYGGVQNKIEKSRLPMKTFFFVISKATANCLKHTESNSTRKVIKKISGVILFNHLRTSLFGNKIHYAISGSAPMPTWLLEWFDMLGVKIYEAYGISENIIPIACNTPQNHKYGTVGQTLPPNKVRLSKDNEVEVKGPGVCSHYLQGAHDSLKITNDGYLQTGDEGTIDANGFISLRGRKSDFFKTSTGKKISPLAIEKQLKQCNELEHILVIGEGRKVPIACATVTTPNPKIDKTDLAEKIRFDVNKTLSGTIIDHQKPAALLLLFSEFTITSGELTANLKLRKKFILEKYSSEIETSYQIIQDQPKQLAQQISTHCLLVIL